jgi:hypothetical protein|tara:strand:- start:911 stop:1108 length:198 start_codon:yes stop_codon:yes gene_type:complete
MNFKQIKERTRLLVNKVSPVSEGSLDLMSDLIVIEDYEKGDVFIGRGKKITRNTLFSTVFVGAFC